MAVAGAGRISLHHSRQIGHSEFQFARAAAGSIEADVRLKLFQRVLEFLWNFGDRAGPERFQGVRFNGIGDRACGIGKRLADKRRGFVAKYEHAFKGLYGHADLHCDLGAGTHVFEGEIYNIFHFLTYLLNYVSFWGGFSADSVGNGRDDCLATPA